MSIQPDVKFVLQRFLWAVYIMLLLVVVGTLGYILIEKWSFLDALYMTVITIAAVGFREVGVLHVWGRIFTMIVIFGGLTAVVVWVASVTSLYVHQELSLYFRKRKMEKEITKLKHHTILCGAGDTGQHIISHHRQAGRDIVVIEQKAELIRELKERFPGMLIIEGDATKEEILASANISEASAIITTLALDADNLFVVISARHMNPSLNIISRAVEFKTREKLITVGANHVVSPSLTEAARMAAMALRPTIVTFIDAFGGRSDIELELEEVEVTEKSAFVGKSLKELEIPQRSGLIVIAINQFGSGETIFNPSSNTVLNGRDQLIVLGKRGQIDRLEKYVRSSV